MIPLEGPVFESTSVRFTVAAPPLTHLRYGANPFGYSGNVNNGTPTIAPVSAKAGVTAGIFTITDDMGLASVDVGFLAMGTSSNDSFGMGHFGGAWGFGGEDFIVGTSGRDFIFGGDDFDRLSGEGDNDVISGGGDIDLIHGREGADMLSGDDGGDLIYGDEGDDVISGGDGNDEIDGGTGSDFIQGGPGIDIIRGGDGDDGIEGGDDLDLLLGENGNDLMFGGSGNDAVQGQDGNDQLMGEDGDDLVIGGDGNDFLSGGPGNDTLGGSKGTDTIRGDEGFDRIFFEASRTANGVDEILDFKTLEDLLVFWPFSRQLRGLDASPGGSSFDAFTADRHVNIGNRMVKLVDIAGGQNITTAQGMSDALSDSGEYGLLVLFPSYKAVIFAASSSSATSFSVFYATGATSAAADGPRVELVGHVDFAPGSNFSSFV